MIGADESRDICLSAPSMRLMQTDICPRESVFRSDGTESNENNVYRDSFSPGLAECDTNTALQTWHKHSSMSVETAPVCYCALREKEKEFKNLEGKL